MAESIEELQMRNVLIARNNQEALIRIRSKQKQNLLLQRQLARIKQNLMLENSKNNEYALIAQKENFCYANTVRKGYLNAEQEMAELS
jgi:hypothetical protein